MKKLFTGACVVLVLACASKKQTNAISLTEDYLKTQMKDPASLQIIKSTVVDTIMMSKWLMDEYRDDTAEVARTIRHNKVDADIQFLGEGETKERAEYEKLLDKKTDIYRNAADTALKELQALKTDRIFFITVGINYRAKNSFGALDVYNKLINYYPADTTFKIQE